MDFPKPNFKSWPQNSRCNLFVRFELFIQIEYALVHICCCYNGQSISFHLWSLINFFSSFIFDICRLLIALWILCIRYGFILKITSKFLCRINHISLIVKWSWLVSEVRGFGHCSQRTNHLIGFWSEKFWTLLTNSQPNWAFKSCRTWVNRQHFLVHLKCC